MRVKNRRLVIADGPAQRQPARTLLFWGFEGLLGAIPVRKLRRILQIIITTYHAKPLC